MVWLTREANSNFLACTVLELGHLVNHGDGHHMVVCSLFNAKIYIFRDSLSSSLVEKGLIVMKTATKMAPSHVYRVQILDKSDSSVGRLVHFTVVKEQQFCC